jgi:hypothetical protein
MLSLSPYPAAGTRQAPTACVHSGGRPAFFAKAREASRGRGTTPSNGLKDHENLASAPVCAAVHFSRPSVETRWPQGSHIRVAVF